MGLQITKTIQTNGVSFELVAGACVAVYFTNGATNNSSKSWTLNVNSTGAKSITTYRNFAAGYASNYAENNDFTYSITGLFVYMNGAYYTTMAYTYGDYAD